MLTLEQTKVIERGKTPLLIIQSRQDASVDPEQTQVMIENLSSTENVDYQYFEELNHGLRKENGDSIDDSALAAMRGWFQKH